MKFRVVGENVLIRAGLPVDAYPVYEGERLKEAEELITRIAYNDFMPDVGDREIYKTKPEQMDDDEIGEIVAACRTYLGWDDYKEE